MPGGDSGFSSGVGNYPSSITLTTLSMDSGRIIEEIKTFTSTSGTAAVNASTGNVFQHTLTENTTASFSNLTAGQVLTIIIVQHASAAKTFGWPATVIGGMTISATTSSINTQQFVVSNDGSTLYALSAGQTGLTGGTP